MRKKTKLNKRMVPPTIKKIKAKAPPGFIPKGPTYLNHIPIVKPIAPIIAEYTCKGTRIVLAGVKSL